MADVGDVVRALREVAFWLERARAATHRVKAFRRVADQVAAMGDAEFAAHAAAGDWARLPGIGTATAQVIAAAARGEVSERLATLRAEGATPLTTAGTGLRAALRGDLHCHSTWSDGGSPVEEMMAVARALGHEYCAITDHSPRTARGLSAERLREQMDLTARLRAEMPGFGVLQGIECDILADGALDQDADLLAELDVVVASAHAQLRMDSESMTHRMVRAIAHPRTNVLGHCTGRLVGGERGTRPPSVFDAEVVFEACRRFDVAVEINAKPERQDPPDDLLALALDMGCLFAIDSDAHAPGQLDLQQLACARAEAVGVPAERVVNTWPADRLLEWCGR